MAPLKLHDQRLKGGGQFDQVARSYDAARIGYPAALFDEIFNYAGSTAVRRALEIGCGTGQATRSVAQRGIEVTCIEIGPHLVELARRNLAAFDNVRVILSSFEEWNMAPEPFDLVFSANAIHWVHPRARTRKTAKALRAGGTLALFRSIPLRNTELERRIDAWMGYAAAAKEPDELPKESQFRQSGYFENFRNYRYAMTHSFDAGTYVDLLFTLQRYHRIPPDLKRERLTRVRDWLDEAGGSIQVEYATHLLLTQRKPARRWWLFL